MSQLLPLQAARQIFQMCLVVPDVHQASVHWSQLLQRPAAPVEVIFPTNGILHHTHGQTASYTDCQVAKYDLGALVLELMQPGPGPSPWRDFLDRNGSGVFHLCLKVDDRVAVQQDLTRIGVDLPYHVGYCPGGSYSYVDSRAQLGLELSLNHDADMAALMQAVSRGEHTPGDEWKSEA